MNKTNQFYILLKTQTDIWTMYFTQEYTNVYGCHMEIYKREFLKIRNPKESEIWILKRPQLKLIYKPDDRLVHTPYYRIVYREYCRQVLRLIDTSIDHTINKSIDHTID